MKKLASSLLLALAIAAPIAMPDAQATSVQIQPGTPQVQPTSANGQVIAKRKRNKKAKRGDAMKKGDAMQKGDAMKK
jgi:Ni/Co efflux regulator RcnB